eukprot:scaffold247618_cov39-Prasinocladus_malaysianus.AAC.3
MVEWTMMGGHWGGGSACLWVHPVRRSMYSHLALASRIRSPETGASEASSSDGWAGLLPGPGLPAPAAIAPHRQTNPYQSPRQSRKHSIASIVICPSY